MSSRESKGARHAAQQGSSRADTSIYPACFPPGADNRSSAMQSVRSELRNLLEEKDGSYQCRYCKAPIAISPGAPGFSERTLYRKHALARCLQAQLEAERALNARLQEALAELHSEGGSGSAAIAGGGGGADADDATSMPPAVHDPAPMEMEGLLVSHGCTKLAVKKGPQCSERGAKCPAHAPCLPFSQADIDGDSADEDEGDGILRDLGSDWWEDPLELFPDMSNEELWSGAGAVHRCTVAHMQCMHATCFAFF